MVIRSNVFAVKGVPQIGVLFSVMNLPKVYWYNFRDTSKRGKKMLGAHQLNSAWVTQLDPCKKKKALVVSFSFLIKENLKNRLQAFPYFYFLLSTSTKQKNCLQTNNTNAETKGHCELVSFEHYPTSIFTRGIK